ncbi:hypothetical protein NUU61_004062 [Penicillium alfredii]|uniref:alpha-glucosidase n=1 Tax=Penicillium alfredii TaxID=1506179 RepID=A0A9W9FKM4_9EURO|nr:uncharacterized protein NUU61_004062 [Penicillium alfredii]KAJ5101840.1 hypothetical protein NUU61_004062 [Penicillium alfredii]
MSSNRRMDLLPRSPSQAKACNVYGTDIHALNLTVEYQAADRLHVGIVPTHLDESNATHLEVLLDQLPELRVQVIRNWTGGVLFSTKGKKLVFENHFVEFSSSLPEKYNIYGLGESMRSFRRGNNYTQTFYNADTGDALDYNLYGTHPFYLETRYFKQDSTGKRIPRNAHGQDVLLRPDHITWRSIGGSIDLYFFAGPTQSEVTKSYQEVVDLPALQQCWTLGFHQCRWGYMSWQELDEVVSNYTKFQIPIETICGIETLKMLLVTSIRPVAISCSVFMTAVDTIYPTFERGNDTGSFLKNPDDSLYIGAVWPGYAVFPDWLSKGAEGWWTNEMVEYYKKVAFDGAWIDMSEISSFCTGNCGNKSLTFNLSHPPFSLPGEPESIVLDYPEGFSASNKTEAASVSAAEYEMHNLWGTGTLHATYKALSQIVHYLQV